MEEIPIQPEEPASALLEPPDPEAEMEARVRQRRWQAPLLVSGGMAFYMIGGLMLCLDGWFVYLGVRRPLPRPSFLLMVYGSLLLFTVAMFLWIELSQR